jgi:2-C-methyl-D-erythritol 4-phosphate cytidylyltransferase/2-C-methyl-D-erythritol 2,4-cyclodiphosphate synthase
VIAAIIAAGGRGERVGADVPKQLLPIAGRPMLAMSIEAFLRHPRIDAVVVVLPPDVELEIGAEYARDSGKPLTVVVGGARRQDSVANGFAAVDERADIVVIHDAARPFVEPVLIDRAIDAAAEAGAAICALQAQDTVKVARWDRSGKSERAWIDQTLSRDAIFLAQTPQAFRRGVLADAIRLGQSQGQATDEAFLAEQAGHRVRLVEGSPRNMKITTAEDLALAQALAGSSPESEVRSPESEVRSPKSGPEPDTGHRTSDIGPHDLRVGHGYDLHRLVEGRRCILGGVDIPSERGLAGHSDADVLCHAITDAILGAAGAGDIGRHFPDTDERWRDASSLDLLAGAARVVREIGFAIVNVDATVIAERPKLAAHVPAMIGRIAGALRVPRAAVSVKGKTNEGIGETGRGEAIACHAVALLRRIGQ